MMRITADRSLGLIIDVQERLLPHMLGPDRICNRITVLIEGLKTLSVPLVLTEQYPRGLGQTVEPIRACLSDVSPIEKIAFSCCDEPRFTQLIDAKNRPWIIIAGIESHVCVLQTAVDLVERGFTPIVVADCTSSRTILDMQTATARMAAEGILITTCESILFRALPPGRDRKFQSDLQVDQVRRRRTPNEKERRICLFPHCGH